MMLPIEAKCLTFIQQQDATDAAHDIEHIRRVVTSARRLGSAEGADMAIVLPAAWLHDCVSLPKNAPDRHTASKQAADKAVAFLRSIDFDAAKLDGIAHAIVAHSFSAGIPPQTLEAKIVQDADRLDAVGAIGIARCLVTGGALNRPLYAPSDPFCQERPPDDLTYTIDHFYQKLFKLEGMLNTNAARKEARRRVEFMQTYLDELAREIGAA